MSKNKSSMKRVRTSEKSRVANKAVRSRVSSARKKLFSVIASGSKEEAKKLFSSYCSVVDKSVKKGVIPKNNANRRKSRAQKKIMAMA